MSNIVPFSNFHFHQDENNCIWFIQESDNAAFANITAITVMCGVESATIHGLISNMMNGSHKTPQSLQNIDLSNVVRIENNTGGLPHFAIPANICYEILYYYAHEARGHEQRIEAKKLCKAMGIAGTNIFIMQKAFYQIQVQPKENIQVQAATLALPPAEQRVETLINAIEKWEKRFGKMNPYMEQQVKDFTGEIWASSNR